MLATQTENGWSAIPRALARGLLGFPLQSTHDKSHECHAPYPVDRYAVALVSTEREAPRGKVRGIPIVATTIGR